MTNTKDSIEILQQQQQQQQQNNNNNNLRITYSRGKLIKGKAFVVSLKYKYIFISDVVVFSLIFVSNVNLIIS
jgi:hypothetical protein